MDAINKAQVNSGHSEGETSFFLSTFITEHQQFSTTTTFIQRKKYTSSWHSFNMHYAIYK